MKREELIQSTVDILFKMFPNDKEKAVELLEHNRDLEIELFEKNDGITELYNDIKQEFIKQFDKLTTNNMYNNEGQGQNFSFLSIIDGKIVKKVKQGTEGAIERKNKNGDTVWELRWPSITAKITDIDFEDHEQYGLQLRISLEDGDEKALLTLPANGGYGYSFLMAIKNADLTRRIKFTPYVKTTVDNGKEHTRQNLYLQHDGDKESVRWYFEKDKSTGVYSHGLPAIKKSEKVSMGKTKIEYDSDEQKEFLYNMIMKDIKPMLQGMYQKTNPVKEEEKSDLPF